MIPSLEMRRLITRQSKASIFAPCSQSSDSSKVLRNFNPKLHDELHVISTGFGGFPVCIWPRPESDSEPRINVHSRINSNMQIEGSAFGEQKQLLSLSVSTSDDEGSVEIRELKPGLISDSFLRTQLDYFKRDTEKMQLQHHTTKSEFQDLYLSNWHQIQQSKLCAGFSEAKREMQSLLYHSGDVPSNESEGELIQSPFSRNNIHRFTDFISRIPAVAVVGERFIKEADPEISSRSMNESNQRALPAQSNGVTDDMLELNKQNESRRIRSEILFDMSSQLLYRKDLSDAEPQVLSHLHRIIDDSCRRRENDRYSSQLRILAILSLKYFVLLAVLIFFKDIL